MLLKSLIEAVVDYEADTDDELGGQGESAAVDDESDDDRSGEESDNANFKRRYKHVEDSVRLDEERRRSLTTADEPKTDKDPAAVKRNKEKDAEPKPTAKQREAAKKRRKEEERAEVSRKAAELEKEKKKLKRQQERSRG